MFINRVRLGDLGGSKILMWSAVPSLFCLSLVLWAKNWM